MLRVNTVWDITTYTLAIDIIVVIIYIIAMIIRYACTHAHSLGK